MFGHLAATAVPGCEEVRDGAYRRTLRLPSGNGIVSLTPTPDHVRCLLVVDDFRDVSAAIARCRRLLDLDADPEAVVETLSSDEDLRALIAKAPGQRIPRTVDEAELALRVVLGQQVSIKAARTHIGRLVAAYGQPVTDSAGGLTHLFPTVEELADIDPAHLAFPKARQRSVVALIDALAERACGSPCRLRLGPRQGTAGGTARCRSVDGRGHRHAWSWRPRRLPRH